MTPELMRRLWQWLERWATEQVVREGEWWTRREALELLQEEGA